MEDLDDSNYVSFQFNEVIYQGIENESLAAALLANGIRTLRYHEESGRARGIYCNIGHCYECRVTIDGRPGVRACLTPVKEGMDVVSGKPISSNEGGVSSEAE
ncbi:(2Fe-2S)-binding protein [Halobacillus sp. Marseille-P3879]|uniref:(2Fe-2S)-binding protein n=1 Tax=Halobacillus sp. Marseille-P3879 TaxID=2045014 RepID=UPI0011AED145|nr:(2Fe-2S)-binding protein [Halobacillus sp. Marseille-P3879]